MFTFMIKKYDANPEGKVFLTRGRKEKQCITQNQNVQMNLLTMRRLWKLLRLPRKTRETGN